MEAKRIYIVEDEPLIADTIKYALEKEGFEVCGIADNAKEALFDIEEHNPDLILLDINILGEIDGVELAKRIKDKFKLPFIFLTSLSDMATLERIKPTRPAGYINKPFNEAGLRNNIEIALHNYEIENSSNPVMQNESFFIKNKGELIRIEKAEVLYLEAYDNYAFIHCPKKKHIVSFTLKSVLEKMKDSRFIRIHKSYVININKINSLYDGYVFIDTHKIPIGKTYKDDLMKSISLL